MVMPFLGAGVGNDPYPAPGRCFQLSSTMSPSLPSPVLEHSRHPQARC